MIDCETIADLLPSAAKAFPDRGALTEDGITSTYSELAHEARALADSLTSLGVGPEVRLGLWAPNSRDWIVAYHATAMAGAVVVPIDATSTPDEVAHILDDSRTNFLVTGTDDAHGLARLREAVA